MSVAPPEVVVTGAPLLAGRNANEIHSGNVCGWVTTHLHDLIIEIAVSHLGHWLEELEEDGQ